MQDNNNRVIIKKKGFSILSFVLGILLGIIIVLGSVFGVGYFALTYDLDKVLNLAGLDNSEDEEGNNKYVNTNPDEGGVANLLELVTKLYTMGTDWQNLTLGQIDALVPATRGVVDQVYSSFSSYVELDMDEVREVRFSEFGNYIKEVVNEIRPAALVESLGLTGDNKILEILLYGTENDCVEVNGQKLPLYFDMFTQNGAYVREGDSTNLPAQYDMYVFADEIEENKFDLCYYTLEDRVYIARKDGVNFAPTQVEYNMYNAEYSKSTGNYYTVDGEKILTDPITVGTFIEGGGNVLDRMLVTDLFTAIDSGESDSELIVTLLQGITVGGLMSGQVDINERVTSLPIGALVQVDPVHDNMMAFLAYGISGISAEPDGGGYYSATYKLDKERGEIPVKVLVEDGDVKAIYDMEGTRLYGTTVGGINDLIDVIDISIFVDIDPENSILAYIAYGVTGISPVEGVEGKYTATIGGTDEECEIEAKDGKIVSVVKSATGEKVGAAGMDDLNGRVNGLTDTLKIGDIVDAKGNKLLEKLGGYTISELSDGDILNQFVIPDLIDIQADNSLIAYLGYGITGITDNGETGTAMLDGEEVYLTFGEDADGNKIITGVYHDDGYTAAVSGTGINEISGRVDSLQDDVKIKDIIDINPDDPLMSKIGEKTLNTVGEVVETLEVSDVVKIEKDNVIMAYLAFGVKEITQDEDGNYTATAEGDTVYFKTKPDGGDPLKIYLEGMYSDKEFTEEGRKPGTLVQNVGDKVDGLMSEVEIKYLVNTDGNKLLQKIGEYAINDVDKAIENIELGDAVDIKANSKIMAYLGYGITGVENTGEGITAKYTDGSGKTHDCTVTVDENGIITEVGYEEDGVHKQVPGTLANEVGDKIDGLTKDLKIKDIIDISPEDKLMSKLGEYPVSEVSKAIDTLEIADIIEIEADSKIMAYLAYGITDVDIEKGEAKLGSDTVYVVVGASQDTDKQIIKGVYRDETHSSPVESTSVNGISGRIDGLTTDLKIKDIIDIGPDDKLMSKLGEYPVSKVSEAIDTLEISDVMSVKADSTLMAYLAYGVTGVKQVSDQTYSGKYTKDGAEHACTIKTDADKNIISVTDDGTGEAVPGTVISGINGRIDGLMSELTLGEIIEISDDNVILSAIKNSTIDGIGSTINGLTLNELYAEEIYKQVVYQDNDHDGQADADEDGQQIVDVAKSKDAKRRIAVSQEEYAAKGPEEQDDYIVFSPAYLYYAKSGDGFTLVNSEAGDIKTHGKLTVLPADHADTETEGKTVYYTYGAPNKMWKLILTTRVRPEGGKPYMDEEALGLNNIGSIIGNVTEKLTGSTLRELDEAGILDFKDSDLETVLDKGDDEASPDDDTVLGDLALTDALSDLIDLINWFNRVQEWSKSPLGPMPTMPDFGKKS